VIRDELESSPVLASPALGADEMLQARQELFVICREYSGLSSLSSFYPDYIDESTSLSQL